MKLKLQETTGLGDNSPIHTYLGLVDNMLKGHRSWSSIHRRVPVDEIYEGMLYYLGHPLTRKDVAEFQVREYSNWLLQRGETVFADLLLQMLQQIGNLDGIEIVLLKPNDIRITMMFILANLEYLKEREGGIRSIDDGWLDE